MYIYIYMYMYIYIYIYIHIYICLLAVYHHYQTQRDVCQTVVSDLGLGGFLRDAFPQVLWFPAPVSFFKHCY